MIDFILRVDWTQELEGGGRVDDRIGNDSGAHLEVAYQIIVEADEEVTEERWSSSYLS